jgi:DNA gyrase subunit A
MIKRTADLVNDKKIEGIANIRDESDRMVCVSFIF